MRDIINRILPACLVAALLLAAPGRAAAWSNHALGTWQALSVLPEMLNAASVTAESLDAFLAAEDRGLEHLLEQEERWARSEIPQYPPLPDTIAFKAGGTPAPARRAFMAALRINPGARLGLFLQVKPGADVAGRATLPWTEVTTLKRPTSTSRAVFLAVEEGEQVAPLDVLASATDEPDYGLDIGLWENNDTAHGRIYGMGKQPFGNPAHEFSSQAPLHMGFYHEPAIVYQGAGFLKRTFPEYRIHLYRSLSSFAFRTGHPYWGWRFAGWALHYVQDLTQPYHATPLPGVGVFRLLWVNTIAMLGFHSQKKDEITLVSNRHLALENYQYRRMHEAYVRRRDNDALLAATREIARDGAYPAYTSRSPRATVSSEAHTAAPATDRTLERTLPSKYVVDPAYVLGETELDLDLLAVMGKAAPAAHDELAAMVADLMRHFGSHTRIFVRSILPAGK